MSENTLIEKGGYVRYAIWGTGRAGAAAYDMLTRAGGVVAFAVDKNKAKHGCDFYGITICSPQSLIAHEGEYDFLIAADYALFEEIKNEALSIGVPEKKIQFIDSILQRGTAFNSIKWTRCPICQAENITVKNGIGICNECGHGFRSSVPEEIQPRYYSKQYWDNDKNRQGITSLKAHEQWRQWVAARLNLLESFGLISHSDPKKVNILEFGCAEGMLLYALKQRGYNVTGNDVCAIAGESMKDLGIEISTQPIEEFSKCGRKFDLIMSFHVMEHLRNPAEIMGNLSEMLSPGGTMLLHVPVDDQELSNADHYHFFSNASCLKLMELATTDIRSDFVHYPIRSGGSAIAATYVGKKTSKNNGIVYFERR